MIESVLQPKYGLKVMALNKLLQLLGGLVVLEMII